MLVTGNEPLRPLHPALSRPGRCASIVEFQPFTRPEAAEWLADRDHEADGNRARTLADLYGVLNGQTVRAEPAFGFA